MEDIPDGVCCVCGHKLSSHIDEGEYWRCHAISHDGYQCECHLIKERVDNDITRYDMKKRIEESPDSLYKLIKEIEEGK